MGSKMNNPGLYEFLIEAELQQYYNSLKNDLKVQNTSQLKYVTEEDLLQLGMSRPEIRRLKKYYQKHFPSNVLAKMKKKLLSKADNPISISSLSAGTQSSIGKYSRNVAPGRHIIQADSIVIHKKLGSGEFGTVQQGVWTDHDGQRIQVAIKCLSQERMENNPVEFLKEAAIMHAVDHEHIVRLYGVVLDTNALMLVTELAPLRSLLECLKEPSMRPNLNIPTLYDFGIQICAGMEYLESKRLIHRDLAARNILVFSRNKVKISDFGLSRALGVGKDYYQTNFNVNLKLPIAWCAPECINFLRFTSASDVWAFGVTLWEMFSYGFQPWAALTGQQILEAIDEPSYQRLEKPECCPHDIYYQVMLKCWQHDAGDRPTFADLSLHFLPECKPEQVQAIRESEKSTRRDLLEYDVGDVIVVLDKKTSQQGDEASSHSWKGVLKDGRCGLFNPGNTVTHLGNSFPTIKRTPFARNDSRSSSLRKGRISLDMISSPQGDVKHTGHVGPDGQVFGDIAFLGSNKWVPRQVVAPYKPDMGGTEPDITTPIARLSSTTCSSSSSKGLQEINDIASSDTAPLLSTAAQMNMDENDHEYHEISDEENDIANRNCGEGVSNPALSSKSQSPLDSPRFEKKFSLEGPSLIDEVFGALQQERPDEAHNVRNELRELARTKKKFATVKPISSSDRKTLDHAINLANELASRSMVDLDKPGKSGTGNSLDDISSPRTPNSPNHRKKFSFMIGSSKGERERRNFSQEANSIPDIQSTLTDEAREAYNSLVEKPSSGALGFLTPSFENKASFSFPEKVCSSKQSELFELEPKDATVPSDIDDQVASTSSSIVRKYKPRNLSLPDERMVMDLGKDTDSEEVDGNPLRLLRQNKNQIGNVLPLPPRDRNKSIPGAGGLWTARHQRKHPLLIPSKVVMPQNTGSVDPPPPPPKPQRLGSSPSSSNGVALPNVNEGDIKDVTQESEPKSFNPVVTTNNALLLRKKSNVEVDSFSGTQVRLYENYDNLEETSNAVGCSKSNECVDNSSSSPAEEQPNADSSGNFNRTNIDKGPVLPEQNVEVDHIKVKTVQRILGSAATENQCVWAVKITQDAAHAVKLLRLKSLLPETMIHTDLERVISVLEMSHYDVARASAFLLDNTNKPRGSSSTSRRRMDYSQLLSYNDNLQCKINDSSNNN